MTLIAENIFPGDQVMESVREKRIIKSIQSGIEISKSAK